MHIRKFILLIPILLLTLIGCSSSKTVNPPSDFRYEAGFLYWSEIIGADHYVIEIDDESKLAYNNKLDLKDFPTGNYTARIATFSKSQLSAYTAYIHFQLIKAETINNILITEDDISWTKHPNLSYIVTNYSHATGLTINSTKTTSSIYRMDGLSNGLFTITINAYLEDTFITSREVRIIKGDFDYVKNAGLVLDLDIPNEIYLLEEKLIEDKDYILDEFGIILNSDLLDTLDVDGVILTLIYDHPVYIYLHLVTIEEPEILSSNGKVYEGIDLTFEFDLKGGSFMGLGGNNISSEDYTFSENTLTIKASYIDKIISNDTNRTMLILTYVLQNDPHIVIGYLFISIPNQSVLD